MYFSNSLKNSSSLASCSAAQQRSATATAVAEKAKPREHGKCSGLDKKRQVCLYLQSDDVDVAVHRHNLTEGGGRRGALRECALRLC